jgi:hypothetical protein
MQLTVYDGAETIGGNKLRWRITELASLFDFWHQFPSPLTSIFEEYLVPRSGRGPS